MTGAVALYRRHGLAWASERRKEPFFEEAWLGRFRALLPSSPTILDLGCGFACPIAAHLIDHGCQVTGIDTAPALLSLARSRFPTYRWLQADMRGLALGRPFDGILAWDSLFHLAPDDQRAMFQVFRNHAGPAAALMFTSGPDAGEAIGSFAGESLYHASLAAPEYRALLSGHGFTVQAHTARDPQCGGRTVWLALGQKTA